MSVSNLVQRAGANIGKLLGLLGQSGLVLGGCSAALGAVPGADAREAGDGAREAGRVVGLQKLNLFKHINVNANVLLN